MIFLSHNHQDKPVVEPVALRLREIFGQERVFYDSWSIQPGEGIIDKINEGLTAPEFVFFFVSEKSLQSGMVKLEWQNALFKATRGVCKIIPIRVDDCSMPAVLLQSLYIDMFSIGIEASIVQIVGVIQGNSTFNPQHTGFSNLSFEIKDGPEGTIRVVISASHLMEPNLNFLILTKNNAGDFTVKLNDNEPYRGGFNHALRLNGGGVCNAQAISSLGGAISPKMPMTIEFAAIDNKTISILGVMHLVSREYYKSIPQKQ